MATPKTTVFVYAHWAGMIRPKHIGVLHAQQAKGKKAFSFEYASDWLNSKEQIILDPDISWFSGPQYPNNKTNFGIFMDSMPDTWGRNLMMRRAALWSKVNGMKSTNLYDIDFLLGVYDETRMGALRFKLNPEGPFLDDNSGKPIQPWSSIRELQHAADQLEWEDDIHKLKKWLAILIAPGSSLGGARPKSNIKDEQGNLWIAKFPSKGDTINKAAWEFLAYTLAIKSGIQMSESRMEIITGKFHTFFTKRFDRQAQERIHFASAMTMTGQNEDTLKDKPASYLDIAEFLQSNGARIKQDLKELWRRLIFNIAISNTDDHLRNHGFVLTDKGWILSPAYDINPSVDKAGLALNVDTLDNSLDFDLAKSVGEFFQLHHKDMDTILNEVKAAVNSWKKQATKIGIPGSEQELMGAAFRV